MLRSDFFSDEVTHVVALGAGCDMLFGDEWLSWEQRTLRDELRAAGYAITELTSAKAAAYKAARTTVGPWVDWEIFENVGHAFNNDMTNFELRQPLTAAECAVTVDALRMCRIVTFTEDVKKYIAACAAADEFLYLPDPLTFAMPYLCPQMYTCAEHGGRELDDLIDGRCDLCVGRYEDGVLIDAPIAGLENRGASIQRYSLYDYAPIASKYEALALLDLDTIQLDLTQVDMQVAKLLDANSLRKRMMARYEKDIKEVRDVRYSTTTSADYFGANDGPRRST
jgi:hypothetical protein